MPLVPEEEQPKPTYDPAKTTYTAERVNFDPTTDTVEGRAYGIIDKNSDLMQLAKTTGNQSANARGLLNSSIGVGAAQREVLNAAVPIANADAGYSLDTKKFNAGVVNEASKFGAGYQQDIGKLTMQGDIQSRIQREQGDISSRLQAEGGDISSRLQAERGEIDLRLQNADAATREKLLNRQGEIDKELQAAQAESASRLQAERGDIDMRLQSADAATRVQLLNRQGEIDRQMLIEKGSIDLQHDIQIQGLVGDQAKQLSEIDNKWRALIQGSANAADIYSNGMAQIGAILADEKMTAESKSALVDRLIQVMNNGLAMTGSFADVDLSNYITKGGSGIPPSEIGTPPKKGGGGGETAAPPQPPDEFGLIPPDPNDTSGKGGRPAGTEQYEKDRAAAEAAAAAAGTAPTTAPTAPAAPTTGGPQAPDEYGLIPPDPNDTSGKGGRPKGTEAYLKARAKAEKAAKK